MQKKMPVLFVGHGSPMNAIDKNKYSRTWRELGKSLPKPQAILSVSAHWYTQGTRINDTEDPSLIYDFYGFPKELYEVKYDVAGSPKFAKMSQRLIGKNVFVDNSWGIDHGTWSVLLNMYPEADIPVFQLSIDYTAPPEIHYQIGRQIKPLRHEGVLILGSGNVVHNLRLINWEMDGGYPWAQHFDDYIKTSIMQHRHENVVNFHAAPEGADLAFRTPDHYYPLLYALGAADVGDEITVFNASCTLGSISMTGYVIQ